MCSIQDITGGPSGPTSEEQGLAAQESDLSRSLDAHYQQAFADQGESLKMLQSTIGRIQSGQTGTGFSPEELAARTAQITANAGAQARNIEQVEANQGAGQVFAGSQDSSGLARSSAIRQQLTGEALSTAETQKSNALENLTAANYNQGRINTDKTAAGLEALSGAYGGRAGQSLGAELNANQSAFNMAEKIHQERDAASGGLGKLIGFGAGLAGKFITGGMAGGGGFGDFMKGGLGALGGDSGMFLKDPGLGTNG